MNPQNPTPNHFESDTPIKLTNQSETGVPIQPFAVSHNLPASQINVLISSLGLRLAGSAAQERAFCEKKLINTEEEWLELSAEFEEAS